LFNDSKVIQNRKDEVGIVAIRNCICHSAYTIRENKEVVVDFHGALHIMDLNSGNTKGAAMEMNLTAQSIMLQPSLSAIYNSCVFYSVV
jgi:hypothetical protein